MNLIQLLIDVYLFFFFFPLVYVIIVYSAEPPVLFSRSFFIITLIYINVYIFIPNS